MVIASLLLAVTAVFTPPRLVSGAPTVLPPPTVVAGGEVLVEALIDKAGNVSQVILLRTTPPYSQMVLDAVRHWRFQPARAVGDDGMEHPVEGAVLIAAVYRNPVVVNGPTLGTAPVDLVRAPSAIAYPMVMTPPVHPIQAAANGVVMMEMSLDEAGIRKGLTVVRSIPGLDAAARDAVSLWQFSGATRLSRQIPSNVYVLVGFPIPVVNDSSK